MPKLPPTDETNATTVDRLPTVGAVVAAVKLPSTGEGESVDGGAAADWRRWKR